jgi:DNA-binding Xre family transcriptional regulator
LSIKKSQETCRKLLTNNFPCGIINPHQETCSKGGLFMKSIIAENTKAILKERGIKQRFLAEKAGYTIASFSNMMNGRKIIAPEDIVNLCTALGVTPNDLFTTTNNQKSA